jgi:hypothetical protein
LSIRVAALSISGAATFKARNLNSGRPEIVCPRKVPLPDSKVMGIALKQLAAMIPQMVQ